MNETNGVKVWLPDGRTRFYPGMTMDIFEPNVLLISREGEPQTGEEDEYQEGEWVRAVKYDAQGYPDFWWTPEHVPAA